MYTKTLSKGLLSITKGVKHNGGECKGCTNDFSINGLDHLTAPAIATTLEHYAILLHKTGKENQACVFEGRAQAIRAKQSKPEGP